MHDFSRGLKRGSRHWRFNSKQCGWRFLSTFCFPAALMASAGALGGCGSEVIMHDSSAVSSLPEPDNIRADANFSQSDYRISPNDVLDINVYQFEKLSRTVQVDGAGRVSLPLIGGVTAAGRTVRELEADITQRFGARYLQSPQVSVFVKESVGRQITVDGSVKKPGVYTLKGRTTLLQALAMAEGLSEVGDTGSVTVIRKSNQQQVSARYDLSSIRSGGDSDPLVYGGDTIVVDESIARHGLQVFKTTVPAVIGLGVRAIP
jgi:polysaccharide biosynthesis/export protein